MQRRRSPCGVRWYLVLLLLAVGAGADTHYVDAARPDDSGDGLAWGTAKRTIQAAVDAAVAGDTVLVNNGIYRDGTTVTPGRSLRNRVVITKDISVRSVNGAAATTIEGVGPVGPGAVRCVYMGAGRLEGFTLRGGATLAVSEGSATRDNDGGGVYAQVGGKLQDCMIVGCGAADDGGGAYGGTLTNCTLSGNRAGTYGGGAYGGTLTNCTLSGNSAGYCGGGADSGTLTNCIVWGNTAPGGANWSDGAISYSCMTPLPSGTGNISVDPRLVSTGFGYLRLRAGSPCVDAGNSAAVPAGVTVDLAGNLRITGARVDMGAYEGAVEGWVVTAQARGRGQVSPAGETLVPTGGNLTLTAATEPGFAFLRFLVNGTEAAATSSGGLVLSGVAAHTAVVAEFESETLYADATRPDDSGDGLSWASAKRTLQAAVDLAWDGDTVLVADGVYREGTTVTPGASLLNRVVITKDITVRSVNGAAATTIKGAGPVGPGAVRCAYLAAGRLEGFTLSGGATLAATSGAAMDKGGGGVYMTGLGDLADCRINDCSAQVGGGALGGTLTNCTLSGNSAEDGGGASFGTLTNCTLSGNSAGWYSGGADYSTLTNCTLSDNSAGYCGGGASDSTLTNCTLTGNSASEYGGGASYVTLTNCVVWGNTAPSEANWSDATFAYSCTTPLPSGTGNISADPRLVSTESGDLRLRSGSPCVDAGDSAAVPAGVTTDLAGNLRIAGTRVDMGAYEGAVAGRVVIASSRNGGRIEPRGSVLVPDAGSVSFSASTDAAHPFRHFLVNGTEQSAPDLMWEWHGADGDGTIVAVFMTAVFYVDAARPDDSGDGLSWGTAKRTIQAALAVALDGDTVRVREGVYVVDRLITVAAGVTLTIGPDAIVKFADGAGFSVAAGGTLQVTESILTHLADDTAGGDSNGDGNATWPQHDRWVLTGSGTITVDEGTETRFLTMSLPSGSLSSDIVLRGHRVYRVSGDVTVPNGKRLTILPGAILKFAAGRSLVVAAGGTLSAVGNRAQPIVFTSVRDDSYGGDTNADAAASVPAPGDWVAIRNDGGVVDFVHVRLRFGGYGQFSNQGDGMARNASGTMRLSNCEFSGSLLRLVAANAGTVTLENCVLRDGRWGVEGAATLTNCVVQDCENSLVGTGTAVNCVILDCTNSVAAGYTLRYCDIWRAGAARTGLGNLAIDPRFRDATTGDYSLRPGSPLIDAGDGSAAPAEDSLGQPRFDDPHVANTGTPSANGACPDIGATEMVDGALSDIDLIVSQVAGPLNATVGEEVTVRWHVVNAGTMPAGGPWRDRLYLQADDAGLGAQVVELGEALTSTTLAPGVSMEFNKTLSVPLVRDGNWRFGVQANAHRDVFEGAASANNTAVAATPVRLAAQPVSLTDGLNGTLVGARPVLLSMGGPAGQSVNVRLSVPPQVLIYYAIGDVPTGDGTTSAAPIVGGLAVLSIPPCAGATVYFLLLPSAGSGGDFSIAVEPGQLLLTDLQPRSVPVDGQITLAVIGAGFQEEMAAELWAAGGGRAAALAKRVYVSSAESLMATFDLDGVAPGQYTLRMQNSLSGEEAVSAAALQVTAEAVRPMLSARLVVPDAGRPGRPMTVAIEYTNIGNVDFNAPVFTIQATGAKFAFDGREQMDAIRLMGLSAAIPAGILRPSSTHRLLVTVTLPTQGQSVGYRLLINNGLVAGTGGAFPLQRVVSEELALFPKTEEDRSKAEELQQRFGATWGHYYANLAGLASELSLQGRFEYDPDTLEAWLSDSVLGEVFAGRSGTTGPETLPQGGKAADRATVDPLQWDRSQCWTMEGEKLWTPSRELESNEEARQDNSADGQIWRYHADCDGWHRLAGQAANPDAFNFVPTQTTYIICHGMDNSIHQAWIGEMAMALQNRYPAAQVLAVDWGDSSKVGLRPVSTALPLPRVASEALACLTVAVSGYLGESNSDPVFASRLTFLGHSHGAHLAGLIGERLQCRPYRIIAMDASNTSVHLGPLVGGNFQGTGWDRDAAYCVEYYRSSYIAGTDRLYGHYNFFVVQRDGEFRFDWGPELDGDRHKGITAFITSTIRNEYGEWDKLGFNWEPQYWDEWTGEADHRSYNGVINTARRRLECLYPLGYETCGGTFAPTLWNYLPPWTDILLKSDMLDYWDALVGLEVSLGCLAESELVSVDARDEWTVGEERSIGITVQNNADSFSLPWSVLCWSSNSVTEYIVRHFSAAVWLVDSWGLAVADVQGNPALLATLPARELHRWQGPLDRSAWVSPGWLKSLPGGITIPHQAFGRRLGRGADGAPLPAGERFLLVFATGVGPGEYLQWYTPELYAKNNVRVQEITVTAGQRPVAVISPSYCRIIDADHDGVEPVSLWGGGSSDDRGIASWQWTVDGHIRPAATTSLFAESLPVGEHTVTLMVADREGLVGSATATVRVVPSDDENPRETDRRSTQFPRSYDPNEMAGPLGFGDPESERYVLPGQWLDYVIYFENKANATAAAQEVFVTDMLPATLDWSTFELGEVVFGNQTELELAGRGAGTFEVAQQGSPYRVRVTFNLDETTGNAQWYLRTVDPTTTDGWPESAYDGFLPPNDGTHRGEGHLAFRVRVRSDAVPGTRIEGSATIIFDTNDQIETDPAWFNTVSGELPAAPAMPGMVDGERLPSPSPLLSWGVSAAATSYRLWIWIDGEAKPEVPTAAGLLAPSFQTSGLAPGTAYRWQVAATNLYGSTPGPEWSFSLGTPPGRPLALEPMDGSTDVSMAPALTASDFTDSDFGDTHAASQWQVSRTLDFSLVAWDSGMSIGTSHTEVPAGRLQQDTAYAWRVRYRDSRGEWSAWSVGVTFATPGSHTAAVDAAGVAAGRGWWDLTGSYTTAVAGNVLVMNVVHDPTGRLTGSATYSVGKAGLVSMPIKGRARGSGGSITMEGSLGGTDPARMVSVSLRLNLTVDTANRQLTGRLTGSVKGNGMTTPVASDLALPIPAPMDGTWTLRFEIDQAGRSVAGTALLRLSNGVDHAFVVQGRVSGTRTVLTLAGNPSDPASKAIRIRTTVTPLEDGSARLNAFAGEGYGQMIGW